MRRTSPETSTLIQRLYEPFALREKILGSRDYVAILSEIAEVPIYEIARVELPPYAWPRELLNQIHGETVMGWTFFAATMKDGMNFTFSTDFSYDFFDLPEGYSYKDIVEIHSGMVAHEDGGLNYFSLEWSGKCYRNKPYFDCYTDCLPES